MKEKKKKTTEWKRMEPKLEETINAFESDELGILTENPTNITKSEIFEKSKKYVNIEHITRYMTYIVDMYMADYLRWENGEQPVRELAEHLLWIKGLRDLSYSIYMHIRTRTMLEPASAPVKRIDEIKLRGIGDWEV